MTDALHSAEDLRAVDPSAGQTSALAIRIGELCRNADVHPVVRIRALTWALALELTMVPSNRRSGFSIAVGRSIPKMVRDATR